MNKPSKYIGYSNHDESSSSLLEERGYQIYDNGHGSFYYVEPKAPEEAHVLANSAAQGDFEAMKAILNL